MRIFKQIFNETRKAISASPLKIKDFKFMKELHKKIMIVLFALFLLGMPILTLIFLSPEQRPFSENENRYLEKFPEYSFESYKKKKFMKGFDDWISDRFFAREMWISLKNDFDKIIGKTENNGVFVTDNMMMEKWSGYDEEVYKRNLEAINNFAVKHSEIPFYFMLIPNAQEIYKEKISKYADLGDQEAFINSFYSSLDKSVKTIDTLSSLNAEKQSYIYYRTDHHWTSYGAYLAYAAAGGALGYTPISNDDFFVEHVSNEFKGTLFSKTLDASVSLDTIDYFLLGENGENEPEVVVGVYESYDTKNNKIIYKNYDSLYFREFLEKKDKYASFLGQNSPVVTITNENAKSDKSLLIIKDSYAHSAVPFFSKEYKRVTMLDLRYIQTDFQTMIKLSDYDGLLFLYNVITFSQDENNIVKLNMCK